MMINKKYVLDSGPKTARLARLAAKAIDLFIVLLLATLFYPLGIIMGCVYLAMADSLQKGQSVGKKFIGLGVVSLEDGAPCSIKQSVIRNLPLLIPTALAIIPLWGWVFSLALGIPLVLLEVFILFRLGSGHRLGDVMADTTVIGSDQNRLDIQKRSKGWFNDEDTQPS